MKQWNKIYKQYKSYGAPLEDINDLIKIFKKCNVSRVLDLGCGSGKHLIHLVEHGFDVYGIDISEEGIKAAKRLLKKKNLKGNLKKGSICKKLPYKDNFFDAVLSLRVLNHGRINEIRKSIREIKRVLRPEGFIFITVQKLITRKKTKIRKINLRVEMIDSRTFFPLGGREKGVIHYIFNKKLLRKEFKAFRIKKLWVKYGKESWNRYHCLFGKNKDLKK